MKELILLLLIIIVIAIMLVLTSLMVDLEFFIAKVFRKTIHKEKYKDKLISRVEECIKYNQERTKFYKGETEELYQPSDCGIATSISEEYLREYEIDKCLIDKMIESNTIALKYYDIYDEKLKQENIKARLKFIETELKDIKRKQGCK